MTVELHLLKNIHLNKFEIATLGAEDGRNVNKLHDRFCKAMTVSLGPGQRHENTTRN